MPSRTSRLVRYGWTVNGGDRGSWYDESRKVVGLFSAFSVLEFLFETDASVE